MWRALAAALVLTACAGTGSASAPAGASALDRDLAAYASASCLTLQDNAYLRDQGQRWASAVIQRGGGAIEPWTAVADAVAAELRRSGVAEGQPETPSAPGVPLPVLTCGEIAAAPAVAAAITAARTALAPAYRSRR